MQLCHRKYRKIYVCDLEGKIKEALGFGEGLTVDESEMTED